MNSKNSNHPELTKPLPIKFSLLGTSQDPSSIAKGPSGVATESTLQSLSRAFNASVVNESHKAPISPENEHGVTHAGHRWLGAVA